MYDAENRMTKLTQASSYVAGTYSYDGDGRRVKRLVGSTETWQVYGLGGELVAEYASNASAANAQKEYGYK
jgi:YD repeat-containing protein